MMNIWIMIFFYFMDVVSITECSIIIYKQKKRGYVHFKWKICLIILLIITLLISSWYIIFSNEIKYIFDNLFFLICILIYTTTAIIIKHGIRHFIQPEPPYMNGSMDFINSKLQNKIMKEYIKKQEQIDNAELIFTYENYLLSLKDVSIIVDAAEIAKEEEIEDLLTIKDFKEIEKINKSYKKKLNRNLKQYIKKHNKNQIANLNIIKGEIK